MSIAAIILAAGASRRLGQPKQEVLLAGETLLARAVRVAQAADLAPVAAVVHNHAFAETLQSLGAVVLVNEHAAEGMATSVHRGVRWAIELGMTGLLLLTCDQPGLSPDHLRHLCVHPERITGSAYAGRVGVPAYFPCTSFSDLLQLTGDAGARRLLQDEAAIPNEALALDVDTQQDLAQAILQYGRTPA